VGSRRRAGAQEAPADAGPSGAGQEMRKSGGVTPKPGACGYGGRAAMWRLWYDRSANRRAGAQALAPRARGVVLSGADSGGAGSWGGVAPRALPSGVFGPRDFAPFLRLASARAFRIGTAAADAAPIREMAESLWTGVAG
jgi:hypothetical protein